MQAKHDKSYTRRQKKKKKEKQLLKLGAKLFSRPTLPTAVPPIRIGPHWFTRDWSRPIRAPLPRRTMVLPDMGRIVFVLMPICHALAVGRGGRPVAGARRCRIAAASMPSGSTRTRGRDRRAMLARARAEARVRRRRQTSGPTNQPGAASNLTKAFT